MNKNTRQLRNKIRRAARKCQDSIKVLVPVRNYHSDPKLVTQERRVTYGDGVVSKNTARNMQMRVLKNSGGGFGSSLTVHEKIHRDEPARPKPRTDDGSKNRRRSSTSDQ